MDPNEEIGRLQQLLDFLHIRAGSKHDSVDYTQGQRTPQELQSPPSLDSPKCKGLGDVDLNLAEITYFTIRESVYALNHSAWAIYKVDDSLELELVIFVPAPLIEFHVEDTLFRMRDANELQRFDIVSWEKMTLYPSWGEACAASRSHASALGSVYPTPAVASTSFRRDARPTDVSINPAYGDPEAAGPSHIRAAIQPGQAESEYYESDLEGSDLTSSDCDDEEETAPTWAPLLGSLEWGIQRIPFSPLLSTSDEYEPDGSSTLTGTNLAPAQVGPAEGVAHQGCSIICGEHWPRILRLIDWRHPTQEHVINLVKFLKTQPKPTQGEPKPPLLCPVVGCHKQQRRPQALRDHLFFHFGIKPYECQHCPRAFETKANCGRHTKTCPLLQSSHAGTSGHRIE
ncbi:hypothetical protein BDV93DRAFT_606576 [Ceratobasidium sp. AG-I]|nr:hypothetical protein BDV93DRAFT_606576 [Ceratobasidium sp. AG-I]